jgi:riboflavin kinase/FMN adenylyltransferase
MKLIEGIENIAKPFRNAVITIGNFDGVHLGHQALFHEVMEKAQEIDGTSVAMTFEPHPMRVLKQNGHPPLITLYEQKVELIERTGIDVLICVPFTRTFAAIPAREFLEEILIRRIGMKAFVVGGDYAFGRNREGNLEFLKQYSGSHNFELIVADWIQSQSNGKSRISSTRIRELVMEGAVASAQKLLGFPTANIKLHDELAPKTGVYAVTVECGDHRLKGVANIGYSPTFDDYVYTVEVHILDFNRDIYGEKIRVNFIERIREEIKFSGIDALARQIERDIETARSLVSL